MLVNIWGEREILVGPARFAIEREMARTPELRVTLPNEADENLIQQALN